MENLDDGDGDGDGDGEGEGDGDVGDAQRTMIAMGEKVRRVCGESKETKEKIRKKDKSY